MKKRILAVCLIYSLFLLGCTGREAETGNVPDSIKETHASQMETGLIETEAGAMEGTYYRMTYTREADADEIMDALLTEDAQKAAYETATVEEITSEYTGLTSRVGSMTVNGIDYRWTEGNGVFSYDVNLPYESIGEDRAEELARDFLERLGWENDDELEIKTVADGTVEIECRLYYDGVKLMGENSLHFEKDNDNEVPVTGFYISLLLSGEGIKSVLLEAVPQIGEVLQAYDAAADFLSMEEVEATARQYFEVRAQSLPPDIVDVDLTSEELEMEAEIIYMPYRDLANGDLHVLMPVFEIYVPTIPAEDTDLKAIIIYMDAVTGYVYDKDFKF